MFMQTVLRSSTMTALEVFAVGLYVFSGVMGYPTAMRPSGSDPAQVDVTPILPILIGAVLFLLVGVILLMGCACCQEERIKSVVPVASSRPTTLALRATTSANSELTLFPPPLSVLGDKVEFDPLPKIFPRKKAVIDVPVAMPTGAPPILRPTHYSYSVGKSKFAVQQWFDDPNANFSRNQLQYLDELGTGWFGAAVQSRAHAAILNTHPSNGYQNGGSSTSSSGGGGYVSVVVKILKADASPSDHVNFLHGVQHLKELRHPHLLRFLGRCLETDPFLLILEATSQDLKKHLQNVRVDSSVVFEEHARGPSLLRLCCDLATALDFLHQHDYIHPDLAARNCLIAQDGHTVKLGDYGTALHQYRDEYYVVGDVGIPIRWSAPEVVFCTEATLEVKDISFAANTWSFGVVMWEIMSACRHVPYEDLSDEEVISRVLMGRQLHPHDTNPLLPLPTILGGHSHPHAKRMVELMSWCWSRDPALRPTSRELSSLLSHVYDTRLDVCRAPVDEFERRWNALKPSRVVTRPLPTSGYKPKGSLRFETDFGSPLISPESELQQGDALRSHPLQGAADDIMNVTQMALTSSSVAPQSKVTSSSHYDAGDHEDDSFTSGRMSDDLSMIPDASLGFGRSASVEDMLREGPERVAQLFRLTTIDDVIDNDASLGSFGPTPSLMKLANRPQEIQVYSATTMTADNEQQVFGAVGVAAKAGATTAGTPCCQPGDVELWSGAASKIASALKEQPATNTEAPILRPKQPGDEVLCRGDGGMFTNTCGGIPHVRGIKDEYGDNCSVATEDEVSSVHSSRTVTPDPSDHPPLLLASSPSLSSQPVHSSSDPLFHSARSNLTITGPHDSNQNISQATTTFFSGRDDFSFGGPSPLQQHQQQQQPASSGNSEILWSARDAFDVNSDCESSSCLDNQQLPDVPINMDTTSVSSYWTAQDDTTSEGTLPADDDVIGSFDGSEPSSLADELDNVVESAIHRMRETLAGDHGLKSLNEAITTLDDITIEEKIVDGKKQLEYREILPWKPEVLFESSEDMIRKKSQQFLPDLVQGALGDVIKVDFSAPHILPKTESDGLIKVEYSAPPVKPDNAELFPRASDGGEGPGGEAKQKGEGEVGVLGLSRNVLAKFQGLSGGRLNLGRDNDAVEDTDDTSSTGTSYSADNDEEDVGKIDEEFGKIEEEFEDPLRVAMATPGVSRMRGSYSVDGSSMGGIRGLLKKRKFPDALNDENSCEMSDFSGCGMEPPRGIRKTVSFNSDLHTVHHYSSPEPLSGGDEEPYEPFRERIFYPGSGFELQHSNLLMRDNNNDGGDNVEGERNGGKKDPPLTLLPPPPSTRRPLINLGLPSPNNNLTSTTSDGEQQQSQRPLGFMEGRFRVQPVFTIERRHDPFYDTQHDEAEDEEETSLFSGNWSHLNTQGNNMRC